MGPAWLSWSSLFWQPKELTVYSFKSKHMQLTQCPKVNFCLILLHLTLETFWAWVHTISTISPHDHPPIHWSPVCASHPCAWVTILVLYHCEHSLSDTQMEDDIIEAAFTKKPSDIILLVTWQLYGKSCQETPSGSHGWGQPKVTREG